MASLSTRRLGKDGPEITRVGFGAWAVGGGGYLFGWGSQDDEDSIRAMRHALDGGVNWIDTAAIYGLGHSEEVVGRLLARVPRDERPYVFTKGGNVWDDANPTAPPRRTLEPASIRRECEASLRRLGIERIDLYQFHWPDQSGVPVEDSWGEMTRLIDEGKVRWGGVSNFDVDLLERCERIRHVDSLQSPFSLIRRGIAEKLLPWCEEHDTGVLAYSPMQSGLLTDKWTVDRVTSLSEDDWRRDSPMFNSPKVEQNLALRDALRPVAERHQASVATLAVAWTLAWSRLTAAIVGARTPEQVDGWLPAASLRLTEDDLNEIATAIERTGAGGGPRRPHEV